MKKMRIYLDTSVINFLFTEDAPDFRKVTEEFFDRYAPKYELYISNIVLLEIGRDPVSNHRALLENVVRTYGITELPGEPRDEIEILAKSYIQSGVVSVKKSQDAFHVAYATIHQMDFLLSWNFRHLANVNKEERFIMINKQIGYRYPLRLVSPLELEDED